MRKLVVKNVSKNFGALKAVDRFSTAVSPGEVTGLIGPNGAGKSTLFGIISGAIKPSDGRIILDGVDITGLRADEVVGYGIARTFQVMRPLKQLTVYENVLIGGLAGRSGFKDAKAFSMTTIERLNLQNWATVAAGDLTLAQQKQLEVARALATDPEMLLLDEVMAGLSIQEIETMSHLVRDLASSGMAVWVTEHNLDVIRDLVDHLVVMQTGKKLADGSCSQVLQDQAVIEAYMGASK